MDKPNMHPPPRNGARTGAETRAPYGDGPPDDARMDTELEVDGSMRGRSDRVPGAQARSLRRVTGGNQPAGEAASIGRVQGNRRGGVTPWGLLSSYDGGGGVESRRHMQSSTPAVRYDNLYPSMQSHATGQAAEHSVTGVNDPRYMRQQPATSVASPADAPTQSTQLSEYRPSQGQYGSASTLYPLPSGMDPRYVQQASMRGGAAYPTLPSHGWPDYGQVRPEALSTSSPYYQANNDSVVPPVHGQYGVSDALQHEQLSTSLANVSLHLPKEYRLPPIQDWSVNPSLPKQQALTKPATVNQAQAKEPESDRSASAREYTQHKMPRWLLDEGRKRKFDKLLGSHSDSASDGPQEITAEIALQWRRAAKAAIEAEDEGRKKAAKYDPTVSTSLAPGTPVRHDSNSDSAYPQGMNLAEKALQWRRARKAVDEGRSKAAKYDPTVSTSLPLGAPVRHAHAPNFGSTRPFNNPSSFQSQSQRGELGSLSQLSGAEPSQARPRSELVVKRDSAQAWLKPIVTDPMDYTYPVTLYHIDQVKAKCDFAEAWLENTVFNTLKDQQTKQFAHFSKGFIAGDGGLSSFLVLHNASNPFKEGPTPKSTTTIGFYGLYGKDDRRILWRTFSPGFITGPIAELLYRAEVQGVIQKVRDWTRDQKPSDRRFHTAYWKCANLEKLGGLLNQADAKPTTGDDIDPQINNLGLTEADVRNDDLGVSEADSIVAWEDVQEAVKSFGKDDPSKGKDHQVLWSSEWSLEDARRVFWH